MAITVNRYWGNGLASSGPELPQYEPWIQSSPAGTNVVWVDSNGTGTADGTEDRPYRTFWDAYDSANVITAQSAIINVKESHSEAPSTARTLSKSYVTVIGGGTGSTRPSFINAVSGNYLWTVTGTGTRLYNLQFPASTTTATGRVQVNAVNCEVEQCDFKCGTLDTGETLNIVEDYPLVTGCTFTSQGTSTTRPGSALTFNKVSHAGITVKDCTWAGGSSGWATTGYGLNVNGAALGFRVINSTLTGATVKFRVVTGSHGWFAGYTPGSNSPFIDWPV